MPGTDSGGDDHSHDGQSGGEQPDGDRPGARRPHQARDGAETPVARTTLAEPPVADTTLAERLRANPRPALVWAAAGAVLLALELGALLDLLAGLLRAGGLPAPALEVPTLLSRETVPNAGHFDGRRWVGTFAGLAPAEAWALRVGLVAAYAAGVCWWLWDGYRRYRGHYRAAAWTPRDDVVDRLRTHRWGLFGLVVVVGFLVLATFAPALGPTTLEQNVARPFSHDQTYWNADAGEVDTIVVGEANLQSQSVGTDETVGPWQYDRFGRFHPLGTTTEGEDLFTFVAWGARVSLAVALSSMLGAGLLALVLALLSAYYRGLADLLVVVTGDAVQSLPVFMLLLVVVVVFQGSAVAAVGDGALLLVGVFVLSRWPFLWRAVRGPALQVAGRGWVVAAESYGQRPREIMRRHMAPYVVGYLFVYTSMSLGGIVVAVAGLSYLGLGISAPTPEWGRLVAAGQDYVTTASWHVSLVPGVLITLVVTGFNALGDGVRDAIDPRSARPGQGRRDRRGGGNGGGGYGAGGGTVPSGATRSDGEEAGETAAGGSGA